MEKFMPRFRFGSVKTSPIFVQADIPQIENGATVDTKPTEPCPISENYLVILRSLDTEILDKCCKAMRNGTAGEPTPTEKGVLRRIANAVGIDDIIALSWSPTYKLYFP